MIMKQELFEKIMAMPYIDNNSKGFFISMITKKNRKNNLGEEEVKDLIRHYSNIGKCKCIKNPINIGQIATNLRILYFN